MKKIYWWLDPGLGSELFEGYFEVEDNATDEEIEYEAKQRAFNEIDWGYEVEEEEDRE